MIGPKRTVFAWLPVWLYSIDYETGVRAKVRRVWLQEVVQCCTFWDGWVAFEEDNRSGNETNISETHVKQNHSEEHMEKSICGAKSATTDLGKPLNEVNDIERLRADIEFLWNLLDDIDTESDISKYDDKGYRARVEIIQGKRHIRVTSDGYALFARD